MFGPCQAERRGAGINPNKLEMESRGIAAALAERSLAVLRAMPRHDIAEPGSAEVLRILLADPDTPANQLIANLKRAPRNDSGEVRFFADFYVISPSPPAKEMERRFSKSAIAAARACSLLSAVRSRHSIRAQKLNSATGCSSRRALPWPASAFGDSP
jgi:hypothetical protein